MPPSLVRAHSVGDSTASDVAPGMHASKSKHQLRRSRFTSVVSLADGRIQGRHSFDYIDLLADFSGEFHALDAAEQESYLQPEPVPQCYSVSQTLANKLLLEGSNGIVYPSVRRHSERASRASARRLSFILAAARSSGSVSRLERTRSNPRSRLSSRKAARRYVYDLAFPAKLDWVFA